RTPAAFCLSRSPKGLSASGLIAMRFAPRYGRPARSRIDARLPLSVVRSAMEIQPAPSKKLLKRLRRMHAKHDAMPVRVEKAELRLERRRIRLQAIESKIAECEHR